MLTSDLPLPCALLMSSRVQARVTAVPRGDCLLARVQRGEVFCFFFSTALLLLSAVSFSFSYCDRPTAAVLLMVAPESSVACTHTRNVMCARP